MIAYTNYTTDARVRREAETLARYDNEVVFLSLSENGKPQTHEMNGVVVKELPVHKYRGKSTASYMLSYVKFLIAASAVCTRLMMKGAVEVVHVHNMPDFLVFAGIVPRVLGRKLILDVHDSMPETYGSKFEKPSRLLSKALCLEESVCCRLAQRVICVNDIQRHALVSRGVPEEKTCVLLNVPDHHIFTRNRGPIRTTNSAGNGRFRLVYHGTVDRVLGIDVAIEAVCRLLNEIPGLEFHVLGTGSDLDEFASFSEKLGVGDCVHFSRKMFPVHDLPELLKDMDVGIVPNRPTRATELMLPVKLLEYVVLGIPIVAARLKTIQHYFTDEMVSYFEPGDVDSLAKAILALYKGREKREKQALRAREFFDTYGWEKHQMDLLRLYETV